MVACAGQCAGAELCHLAYGPWSQPSEHNDKYTNMSAAEPLIAVQPRCPPTVLKSETFLGGPMDADELFIRTLADLDDRTDTKDEYEALLSAGLIRKLLLDQHSLMAQVNRERRLEIRFRINGESAYERIVLQDMPWFWLLGNAIDPDKFNAPPGLQAPLDASLKDLLSRTVMFFKGSPITVKDLIRQIAHIDGAVHKGRPQNPREELIDQVSRFVFINNLPAGVRQVQLIAGIVVRGLTPLRDAIARERQAS